MANRRLVSLLLMVLPLVIASCSQEVDRRPPMVSFKPQNIPVVPRSVSQMQREVRIDRSYMPESTRARRMYSGPMTPKFITIHSTANPTGDASSHSKYLNSGKSGSLCWHFTVDQAHAVQHLPLNRHGHHADHSGPGDKYSIAIEMCEVRWQSPARTYDRAAKLTATLMQQYNIPLRNVVPHFYWSGKNCPSPILDGGRPGYKWSWFISRVDYYNRCLKA
jgi:N-acetylmuramoyl-L-alanine amidase